MQWARLTHQRRFANIGPAHEQPFRKFHASLRREAQRHSQEFRQDFCREGLSSHLHTRHSALDGDEPGRSLLLLPHQRGASLPDSGAVFSDLTAKVGKNRRRGKRCSIANPHLRGESSRVFPPQYVRDEGHGVRGRVAHGRVRRKNPGPEAPLCADPDGPHRGTAKPGRGEGDQSPGGHLRPVRHDELDLYLVSPQARSASAGADRTDAEDLFLWHSQRGGSPRILAHLPFFRDGERGLLSLARPALTFSQAPEQGEVFPILFEIRSPGSFQAHRDSPEALIVHEQPEGLHADVSFADMLVAASAILFDPIFQGLAISLMAGEVASLLLSRVTVPFLYYLSKRQ